MGAKKERGLIWILVFVLSILIAGVDDGQATDEAALNQIRDIGIPVRAVTKVRLHAGFNQAGQPCLYAVMGQQADNFFVLQIDPETGKFRQFMSGVKKSNYPITTLMSSTGKLYIGAAYAGHLLCFDPEADALLDLGAINPGKASFPCQIDEDAQGRIWVGSYGTADLTCYVPATGEFIRYGRMDEVDMYCYPLVNADGKVASLIRQTKPHVVVLDPDTGEKQVVGPVTTKGEATISLHKGSDRSLYIKSSLGNFRIEGMSAVPVETIPKGLPRPVLPDGSRFRFSDSGGWVYRTLEITKPDGETRTFHLDYEAKGSDIFYIHEGPDGLIYGSSILPLHLFRYHPETGDMVDLGKCAGTGGEAYSMGNLDGKLYISAYTGSRLSVYDPERPYHFGKTEQDNPRDLGRIDDISYRPRSTLTGPKGRVWVASVPDYGRWGGPLSYYDPSTGDKKAYYRIVGDASCYTLAHLEREGLIAVGTTVSGGSGTRPKVDQAVLFLFDYEKEEKVWESTPDRHVSAFNALLTGPNGKLFGTLRGKGDDEIFVFDPKLREFTHRIELPNGSPLDLGLQMGPDGMIYGFTSSCIYQLDPNSLNVRVLVEESRGFGIAGPIVGRDIYFGKGHLLRAARIF